MKDILINQSQMVRTLRAAFLALKLSYRESVARAFSFGQLLNEAKKIHPHGDFQEWLKSVWKQIDTDADGNFDSFRRNCNRWMQMAETVTGHALGKHTLALPISTIISSDASALAAPEQEAQQLLLDFMDGKTIKECLAGVVVDGDEAHRLTRAVNGKTKGGHNGEDRKAWHIFVQVKLKNLSEHLSHWKAFRGGQAEAVEKHFAAAIEKWPSPVLEFLKQQINTELKRR